MCAGIGKGNACEAERRNVIDDAWWNVGWMQNDVRRKMKPGKYIIHTEEETEEEKPKKTDEKKLTKSNPTTNETKTKTENGLAQLTTQHSGNHPPNSDSSPSQRAFVPHVHPQAAPPASAAPSDYASPPPTYSPYSPASPRANSAEDSLTTLSRASGVGWYEVSWVGRVLGGCMGG